jgi:hypothetical protein
MKNILLILSLSLVYLTQAQTTIVPFVDFNNWFRSVENGEFKYIDMQEIKGYKAGDYVVAYIDIRGNLRVYDGTKRYEISNMELNYLVSDKLVAWNVGTTLGVWNAGKTKILSYFGGPYIVKDDIVVYVDTRFNSMMAHWNGAEYPIQTSTTDIVLKNSSKIGENILAYADNGGLYKVFYKGNYYEIGVWNGDIDIQSGTDVVAFNDPNTRTFAVFDKGQFIDIEDQWVKKYKAGRGFVVYEDIAGNVKVYRNGHVFELSSFSTKWDVVDDIILFEDNGYTYCDVNGTKTLAANYRLTEYKIKNATLAFRNSMNGVSAVVDGQVVDISNMQNGEFDIFGNSVLVKLFNKSFIVYQNGKNYRL